VALAMWDKPLWHEPDFHLDWPGVAYLEMTWDKHLILGRSRTGLVEATLTV
jgi:hypothetical protein